ncbi:hypothetical protein E4U41_007740, partial [Claviceps citrina]
YGYGYGHGHNPHDSSYHGGRTESYISSYGPSSPTPAWAEHKRPHVEELGTYTPVSPSAPTSSPSPFRPEMTQLAEMESPEPPNGWTSTNKPNSCATPPA